GFEGVIELRLERWIAQSGAGIEVEQADRTSKKTVALALDGDGNGVVVAGRPAHGQGQHHDAALVEALQPTRMWMGDGGIDQNRVEMIEATRANDEVG